MSASIRSALLSGRRRPLVRGGARPYPRRGDGLEIAELRAYVEGDDPRRIDWAATARAGGLQTRVLMEEHALCFAAIVDTSPSMRVGKRRMLLDAAHEALDAWSEAMSREDRAVRIFSSDVDAPHLVGHAAAARLRERHEDPAFDLEAALRLAAVALPKDAALLVISDFFAMPDEALLHEVAVRVDATALVARDPWHDGLPLRGFARVRDVERGGSRLAFFGRRERRRFAAAVREREHSLLRSLGSCGWRTGVIDEGDGAVSLGSAFGFGAPPLS